MGSPDACTLLERTSGATLCGKSRQVGEGYDEGKVDEMVLALLYLTMFEDSFAE